MVTHEAPGSTFWDRIRAGAEQAAKQHGIELKYSNDPDSGKQATLVQNAIDSKVDGIAVTLASARRRRPGAAEGRPRPAFPVVVFNAGIDTYQQYGALMFFGSDESLAGQSRRAAARPGGAGRQGALRGARAGQQSRWRPAAPGSRRPSRTPRTSRSTAHDLPSVQPTIQAKLAQDPSITDIVTLDAGVAGAAVQAKDAAGSQAKIVTFDLNPEVVQAIKDKKVEFSVDQQPYLQGYLAVDSLWLQPDQRQRHRRRQARAHRPVVRRRHQHRQDRRLRREQHPLTCA